MTENDENTYQGDSYVIHVGKRVPRILLSSFQTFSRKNTFPHLISQRVTKNPTFPPTRNRNKIFFHLCITFSLSKEASAARACPWPKIRPGQISGKGLVVYPGGGVPQRLPKHQRVPKCCSNPDGWEPQSRSGGTILAQGPCAPPPGERRGGGVFPAHAIPVLQNQDRFLYRPNPDPFGAARSRRACAESGVGGGGKAAMAVGGWQNRYSCRRGQFCGLSLDTSVA